MNGCRGRWLRRLDSPARWHPARVLHAHPGLPCSATRSLSHGSCLLNRVRTRKSVSITRNASPEDEARFVPPGKRATSAPPDETPFVPRPEQPVKELKDSEGRKYFMAGFDGKYHCRHSASMEGGYVKAAYTARATYLNPSTKIMEYGKPIKRPLLILYNYNFVEDEEFWDEVSVLCDFATSVTERGKDIRGHSPEKDTWPVEFIYVQARFHHNARASNEPWHITVDIGNRKTWNDGAGFFRVNYHIYAKNDDISQGYEGYRSPILMSGIVKNIQPSQWAHNIDGMPFTPWGQRSFYRHPHFRSVLYEATQQSLEPPAASQFQKRKNWMLRPNPITMALEKVELPSIPDQLDDLLKSIHEGASKAPSPPKGHGMLVVDHSGNWVNIHEAVKNAKSEGKEVPPSWKIILQNSHASKARKLRKTSRSPVLVGATRLAFDKTTRVSRTTRSTKRLLQWSPRPKGSGGSDVSSTKQPKSHGLLDEHSHIRRELPGAGEPGLKGDVKSKWERGPMSKGRSPVSAMPQRPQNSKAVTRASRTKLTIRDPLDKGAGVGHRDSGSQELASKAGDEKLSP